MTASAAAERQTAAMARRRSAGARLAADGSQGREPGDQRGGGQAVRGHGQQHGQVAGQDQRTVNAGRRPPERAGEQVQQEGPVAQGSDVAQVGGQP